MLYYRQFNLPTLTLGGALLLYRVINKCIVKLKPDLELNLNEFEET